jgi:D-amino peptidase
LEKIGFTDVNMAFFNDYWRLYIIMKIYLMTDMEGVCGVINSDDYASPSCRYYEIGRELTTMEVNSAIDGLLEAGATEILVVDGHGAGAITPSLLHREAKLLAGSPMGYPFGCDDSFDAAIMIGQHAKTNTDGGHLCHTGSFAVEDMLINGVSVGEAGCNMLFASYFNVPTIMLSGDESACNEVKALVPNMEVASVKTGIKRGSASGLTAEQNKLFNGAAIHLSPEKANMLIYEKAKIALEHLQHIKPFWLAPPYEMVSAIRPSEPDGRTKTARVTSNDLIELLSMPRKYE